MAPKVCIATRFQCIYLTTFKMWFMLWLKSPSQQWLTTFTKNPCTDSTAAKLQDNHFLFKWNQNLFKIGNRVQNSIAVQL